MTELRYALRMLARSKGFAVVAILSLALAIGLTTTSYAILDSFLNPYYPYREPDRVISLGITGDQSYRVISSFDRYQAIRDRTTFAEDLAVTSWDPVEATIGIDVQDVTALKVSTNYFSLLGVEAERGRTFQPSGDENAVVVSRAFWIRGLGRRPLDQISLMIDGAAATVIGVMPASMTPAMDLWRVLDSRTLVRGRCCVDPIARLKPGVTIERAQSEMTALGKDLTNTHASRRFVFRGVAESVVRESYRTNAFVWALVGCAGLLLLIACANLANLMLARGIARRGEMALRLAIGASRKTLVRQLLTESAILAVAGGTLGTVFAAWGASELLQSIPRMIVLAFHPIHLGWRVFAFGLLVSASTIIAFGLYPALRASDVDVAEPLKESAGTTTGRRNRRISGLAIAQVALALVVVMAASLMTRSAYRYATEDWGYDMSGLFWTRVDLSRLDLPDAAVGSRFENIRDVAAGVPGVKDVASYVFHPIADRVVISDYIRKSDSLSLMVLPSAREVSAGFLRTRGIKILAGRDFEPGDRDVAIVNEGAARRLWPNLSPIGRLIKLGSPTSKEPWLRVVGLVPAGRDALGDPALGPVPEVYLASSADVARSRQVLVRVDRGDRRVAQQVARQIQAAAGLTSPLRMIEEAKYQNDQAAWQAFASWVFVFLGICALGLASIGLYGVLAYTVSRRMREFGVRIALGATNSDMFRLVLTEGTIMVLAGTALGAFAALGGSTLLDGLLYRINFSDVTSLVISELVLCTTAFLACLSPALRAMRSDPVEILRAT